MITQGLDIEWCKGPDVGLLSPDLTIFLDLSEEEQQKRGGFGEERYETMELQRKVRQCFHKLCTSDWKVIYQNLETITIFR